MPRLRGQAPLHVAHLRPAGGQEPKTPEGKNLMASSVRSLTDADFAELVAEVEVPVLVDFWAPWCGPCRQLAPVVESLQDDYGSALLVVKVNVDESPAVTAKYNVGGVPTLMLFKGGEPVHQLQGARPKGAILAVLAKHL